MQRFQGVCEHKGYLEQEYLTVKNALADTDFQTYIFKYSDSKYWKFRDRMPYLMAPVLSGTVMFLFLLHGDHDQVLRSSASAWERSTYYYRYSLYLTSENNF